MSEKVLKATILKDCKVPKSLVIGDEMYLEEMVAAKKVSEKNKYKKLIFSDKHIPNNWKMCVIIETIEEVIEGYQLEGVRARIGLARPIKIAKGKDLCDVFAKGRTIGCQSGENLKISFSYENKDLGCDTASFTIYPDKDWGTFQTGADGYYGMVTTHYEHRVFVDMGKSTKDVIGYTIELYISGDMIDHNEMVTSMKSLFGGIEIVED